MDITEKADLPVQYIFGHAGVYDLCVAARVSREWNEEVRLSHRWSELLRHYYSFARVREAEQISLQRVNAQEARAWLRKVHRFLFYTGWVGGLGAGSQEGQIERQEI